VHLIEGLPLLTVPPAKLSGSSLRAKRVIDIVGAMILLLIASPVFILAAFRIRRESEGPVFFRQKRLGENMKPFTALKFRTMTVGVSESEHRDYIRQTMSSSATMGANGTYKLDRENVVTPFGKVLRKTSLDELPQLINVLRGEMSLVGPRPCIPYETEFFEPHHFDRFLVPQGMTGLWQVAARARSSFGEALEMDVAYVRGWSLGLDVRLILRTPFALFRQRKATA
jgi:lipopolysaccharide/colanic/teichoic acid biosynthesis glycosyltransferase